MNEELKEKPDPLLHKDLDARVRGELSRQRREAIVGSTWQDRLKHWAKGGPAPAPLPALLEVLEPPERGRYGICCSGGGIRSAAFNLGALQVLQAPEHRILQRATYLSAVSGGSYMAAGFAMVAKVGNGDNSDPKLVTDDAPPFHPGSPEEQYLRNRSSYMASGFGGKMRLLSRVLLGVLVNLLYLGSALFVLGWLIGWGLYGELLYAGLRRADGNAHTEVAGIVALGLFTLATILGLASILVRFKTDEPAACLRAWAARLLGAAAIAALVLVAMPALIEWLRDMGDEDTTTAEDLGGKSTAALLGSTGGTALLLSILAQLRARMTDSRLLSRAVDSGRKGLGDYLTSKVLPRVRGTLVVIATALAGPLLLGGILFVSALAGVVDATPGFWTLLALVFAVGFFAALSKKGDVNAWSLHSFYRRRLASAFALKRVCGDFRLVAGNREGRPIAVERDYDVAIPLSESGVEPGRGEDKTGEWPQLVVCAAANVSDPGATPPGRPVTSFTFSPRVIGGPLIGTISTEDFQKAVTHRLQDFTLPAAVAMSGAALSPSMGKLTRAPMRFLLTLGNARLGVWVPNPRRMEEFEQEKKNDKLRRQHGRPRPFLLIRELLGRNSADAKYLYVTDGGHYENLGLVELLRRGCLDVYCFDASGGADIQELGDAIALARTELGVEVTLEPEKASEIVPDAQSGLAKTSCVTGEIRFPDHKETGTLVYVRSVLTADAPHDVRAYREVDPAFPHNSTGDQLYTDQRFEAYRQLGRSAATAALALPDRPLSTPQQD